jgi:hypothetical protein
MSADENHTKLDSEIRDLPTKLQSDLRDFWDVQAKVVNYLMIAHAAGLVTCVTLLKDYKDNPQLKGIGLFVVLFGIGLVAAIIAFGLLLRQSWGRTFVDWLLLFSSGESSDVQVKQVKKAVGNIFRNIRLAAVFWGISAVILLAAIVVATWKFGSL